MSETPTPDLPRALAAAVALHRTGRLEAAEAAYDAILQRWPDDPDALHLLGVVASQRDDHERALTLIGRALHLRPEFPGALHNLGNALQALNRDDEAVEAYRRAIALDPRAAASFNNLGNILSVRGDGAEAIASFRRAIDIVPDYAAAHANLGAALLAQGRLGEALDTLRRAAALDPGDAGALNNLGKALAATGAAAAAAAAYRKAIEAAPQFAVAYNNLGAALAESEPEQAIIAWRAAVRIDPGYATAHFNLALGLAEHNRNEEAVAGFQRALALQPDWPRAHLHRGRAFLSLGRYREAVDDFVAVVIHGSVTDMEESSEPPPPFNRDNRARDALVAFKAAMDGAGIPFFLCFGTLLGCVRDGDFLAHDYDIDVGVSGAVSLRDVVVAASPAFECATMLDHDGRDLYAQLVRNGDCTVDVYGFFESNGMVLSGARRKGVPIFWTNTPFDLAPIRFIGTDFLAPADTDRYLTESYGDWRTPEPIFEGMISSANVAGVRELPMKALQYAVILDALRHRHRDKAARLCEHLLAKTPDDDFATMLLGKLRAAISGR